MLKILAILVIGGLGLLAAFVVGCLVFGAIRAKPLKYQVTTVEGKVVRKEHNGDEFFKIGNKVHRVQMEHEYLVFVLIDGEEIEIDDAEMFSRAEVDDTVKLEQHRGYNKNGKIRHEYYEPAK